MLTLQRLFPRLKSLSALIAIYGGSVGVLLIGELLLSRQIDARHFGEYQYVRQLLPLVVGIGLFGVDQALTRNLASGGHAELVRPLVRQSMLVVAGCSAVAGLVSFMVYDLSPAAAGVVLLAPVLLVVSELTAASLRAASRYSAAAFAQQGYRLMTGVAILALAEFSIGASSAVIAIGMSAVGIGLWCHRRELTRLGPVKNPSPSTRSLRILGAGFGLSMVATALLDWADQATVAFMSHGLEHSGRYAAVKLATVYPFVSFASIVGFLVLPELVKRRAVLSPVKSLKLLALTGASGLVLWPIATFAAARLVPMVLGREVSLPPLALLIGVGILRLVYLVPSGIIGAFGSAKALGVSGLIGFAGVLLEVGVIVRLNDLDPVTTGAAGLFAGSLFRLVVAVAYAQTSVIAWHRTSQTVLPLDNAGSGAR